MNKGSAGPGFIFPLDLFFSSTIENYHSLFICSVYFVCSFTLLILPSKFAFITFLPHFLLILFFFFIFFLELTSVHFVEFHIFVHYFCLEFSCVLFLNQQTTVEAVMLLLKVVVYSSYYPLHIYSNLQVLHFIKSMLSNIVTDTLEKWSHLRFKNVIFDSDVDESSNREFNSRIKGRSNLYFINIDENGMVFSVYAFVSEDECVKIAENIEFY